MDKKEIIRRLKRMSEHAVYMPGIPPFIMSLDDGVAADEAAMLLEEQPEIVRCKDCVHRGRVEKCVLAAIAAEKGYPLFMLDNRGEWFCADGEREKKTERRKKDGVQGEGSGGDH